MTVMFEMIYVDLRAPSGEYVAAPALSGHPLLVGDVLGKARRALVRVYLERLDYVNWPESDPPLGAGRWNPLRERLRTELEGRDLSFRLHISEGGFALPHTVEYPVTVDEFIALAVEQLHAVAA